MHAKYTRLEKEDYVTISRHRYSYIQTLSFTLQRHRFVLFIFLIFIPILFYALIWYINECRTSVINHWTVSPSKAKLYAEKLRDINFNHMIYSTDLISFDAIIHGSKFQVNSHDVMVFLHMQKTGGTSFEKALTRKLALGQDASCKCTKENRKRCTCLRPARMEIKRPQTWLFSRYSIGWRCGLHADWTELNLCVANYLNLIENDHHPRRYFYITILREPVQRYISEFRHIMRGGTWKKSRHMCGNPPRQPTAKELPACYDISLEGRWPNVTLDEFIDCPHNLAHNRMTRMLADLNLVHCYDKEAMTTEERNRVMLRSAMHNIQHNIAYFAILEDMNASQFLFEDIFNIYFNTSLSHWTIDKSSDTVITPTQLHKIEQQNLLDIELYKFAKKLFEKRVKERLLTKSKAKLDVHMQSNQTINQLIDKDDYSYGATDDVDAY